ncbi:MAG TPA: cell division protein FtsA [Candidatus Paceibacterota bacterium]|nr:cell division protein FtsA [Candidatus Paceibacterota bacterium]
MPSYHLCLDLGSYEIKSLVGRVENGEIRILSSLKKPSQGIKNGVITDPDLVAERVGELLSEIEMTNKKMHFYEAIIGIGGTYLDLKTSKGVTVISRSNQEVTEDDVEKAFQAAQALALPQNRILIQAILKNFRIDGGEKVKDPVGMKGIKLEAESLLIDIFSPVIKKIDEVGEMLGLAFNKKCVLPLAGAEFVLNERDKDLGVMTIDFGADTTSICVYEDGELIDLKVFPFGSNHVTNDIAVGLKTYIDIAEKLKIKEGVAYSKKVSKNDNIEMADYGEEGETKVSKKFLAEIIEARLMEILDLIGEELKQIDKFNKLPAGIVIYGGGAKTPYLSDLVKERLKLSVRVFNPDHPFFEGNPSMEFVPVLGLLNFFAGMENERIINQGGKLIKKIFKPFTNLFKF